MTFRIGCQTITFGESQRERLPQIFATLKSVGYEGVEMGLRHVLHLTPRGFHGLLKEHELNLIALHLGGNLDDAGQASGERKLLEKTLDYANETGAKFILYSGLKDIKNEELNPSIQMLNRAVTTCRERGVRLLYHPHNWEFADNMLILRALLNESDPELGFCPDVGWLKLSHYPFFEFLEEIRGRLGAIHFKDFATSGQKFDTVELGKGIVPWADLAKWLNKNFNELWVIAEQDATKLTAEDAVARNADFCRTLLGLTGNQTAA